MVDGSIVAQVISSLFWLIMDSYIKILLVIAHSSSPDVLILMYFLMSWLVNWTDHDSSAILFATASQGVFNADFVYLSFGEFSFYGVLFCHTWFQVNNELLGVIGKDEIYIAARMT
jgi:hypothetical protein